MVLHSATPFFSLFTHRFIIWRHTLLNVHLSPPISALYVSGFPLVGWLTVKAAAAAQSNQLKWSLFIHQSLKHQYSACHCVRVKMQVSPLELHLLCVKMCETSDGVSKVAHNQIWPEKNKLTKWNVKLSYHCTVDLTDDETVKDVPVDLAQTEVLRLRLYFTICQYRI